MDRVCTHTLTHRER